MSAPALILPGVIATWGDPETGLPYAVIGILQRGIEDAVESLKDWRAVDHFEAKIADLTERLHPRR